MWPDQLRQVSVRPHGSASFRVTATTEIRSLAFRARSGTGPKPASDKERAVRCEEQQATRTVGWPRSEAHLSESRTYVWVVHVLSAAGHGPARWVSFAFFSSPIWR
jgi:hypothetical protein